MSNGTDQNETAARDVIRNLRAEGVGAEEMEGALNRARRSLVSHLNSVGDRADAFAGAVTLRDDPSYVNAAFGRYGIYTTADTNVTVTRDGFKGKRRSVL